MVNEMRVLRIGPTPRFSHSPVRVHFLSEPQPDTLDEMKAWVAENVTGMHFCEGRGRRWGFEHEDDACAFMLHRPMMRGQDLKKLPRRNANFADPLPISVKLGHHSWQEDALPPEWVEFPFEYIEQWLVENSRGLAAITGDPADVIVGDFMTYERTYEFEEPLDAARFIQKWMAPEAIDLITVFPQSVIQALAKKV